MIVGGYDLHLYCDTGNVEPDTEKHPPHGYEEGRAQIYGRNEREAMATARAAGWTFKAGGFTYCPRCSRK